MRHRMAVVLVVMLTGLTLGATPGPKNGFRSLKWGAKPSREMTFSGKRAGLDSYLIPLDNARVAQTDGALISYMFSLLSQRF